MPDRRMTQELPAASAIKREDSYRARGSKAEPGRVVAIENTTPRMRREFTTNARRFGQERISAASKPSGERALVSRGRSVSK